MSDWISINEKRKKKRGSTYNSCKKGANQSIFSPLVFETTILRSLAVKILPLDFVTLEEEDEDEGSNMSAIVKRKN